MAVGIFPARSYASEKRCPGFSSSRVSDTSILGFFIKEDCMTSKNRGSNLIVIMLALILAYVGLHIWIYGDKVQERTRAYKEARR